jgi:LacI family transcriptional regulator
VLSAGSGWDPARERRYVEELLRLRVRGIVMAPVGEDLGRLRSIVESGTRLVLVSHGRPEIGAPTVMSDAVAAGRLATEHLLAHGYETVVCLTGPDDAPPVGHRVRGWRAALREHGRSADAVLVRSGYDRYSAERAALGVLERQRGRVAVLGATDELALGVLAAAARLGRAVPAECAVVGCDGIPEGVQAVPALTTVAEPIEAIAASVVRCLLAERVPASPSPLPVALRLGGTCGPH